MTRAIQVLRYKGIDISEEEYRAVCIAILLHDIGHGPYSHALEGKIINAHHEVLSLRYMEILNEEFGGELSLAIRIFKNNYEKQFLGQLVSGQLDMDRMDYLNRDSFFTGVAEGVIGYDRIIEMLNVRDDQLVIEEKGIYSIEKFLIARRIMYWQVYLHKASVAAEQMLVLFFKHLKEEGFTISSKPLTYFLSFDDQRITKKTIHQHSLIDDSDMIFAVKELQLQPERVISILSDSILNRRIFKCHVSNEPYISDFKENIRQKVVEHYNVSASDASKLISEGKEDKIAYDRDKQEILILKKDDSIIKFSDSSEFMIEKRNTVKYFLCHPKLMC